MEKNKLQTEFFKINVGEVMTKEKNTELVKAVQVLLDRQKAEIISLIYSMILNKEIDDVEASKIINKIRSEEKPM